MKQKSRYIWTNIKLVCTIVPIVLLMIVVYFILVRNEIIALSKAKLALESQNYAEDISTWADSVLQEVTIYKSMVEQIGLDKDETYEMMKTSAGTHSAYPYGLYMGDDQGNYFDSSGWIPGDDFVVTERDWYKEGLAHDTFSFGEPYVDAMTGSTCVSVTSRLNTGSAVSVMAADVYLDYAAQLTREITVNEIENAFFVTRESRLILADSNPAMVGNTLSSETDSLLYQNVNRLLDSEVIGQREVFGSNGSIYFVSINMIEDTGWYFVTSMNQKVVLNTLWRIEFPMLIVAIAAALLLFAVTSKFSREMSIIRKKAKRDPLTNLWNRNGFEEYVRLALEENPGQGLLLIIDMDNFKLVNDQLGHPVGDKVLQDFSCLLESYFNRNKDMVSRLGGDEFAVFIGRNISSAEAEAMLTKFIGLVHQNLEDKYPAQNLSASIGAAFVSHSESYNFLYQNADKALYEAKRNGKNRFHIR